VKRLRLDDLKSALEQKPPPPPGSEAYYKRRLVAEINRLSGGYARRIEDRFAVGVLDMLLKLPGLPLVFAEGKIIDGNLFGPTERQFEEGKRLIAADIRPVLIGWKDGRMHVSRWVQQADYHDCFYFPLPGASYAQVLWEFLSGVEGEL
jgi:hypothetical protein